MDIDIQREHNDLVVSTFGRGIYILDDYSPLRNFNDNLIKNEALLFPVENADMFIESNPFGFRGVGFMGASFYAAENPKVGAVITYYLKDEFKDLLDLRREKEKEAVKNKKDIKYPTYEQLKKENLQPKSYLLFTIKDSEGNAVKKIKTEPKKGVNRVTWDFRYSASAPISLKEWDDSVPWNEPTVGYMAVPGKYTVEMSKFEDGIFTNLSSPKEFNCKPLHSFNLNSDDINSLDIFNKKVAELSRAINGVDEYWSELHGKLDYFKKAVFETTKLPENTYNEILNAEKNLDVLKIKIHGDQLRTAYDGGIPASIKDKIDLITGALWTTTSAPTKTFIKSYEDAANQFDNLLADLKKSSDEIDLLEAKLEKLGAPFTPGRFPVWKK
jgi:hypothetical protein